MGFKSRKRAAFGAMALAGSMTAASLLGGTARAATATPSQTGSPQTGAAASAAAGSIVYLKGGYVWIAHVDGTHARQFTKHKFNWSSPSEADNGTVVVAGGLARINKGGTDSSGKSEIYRFKPNGQQIGGAIPTWGSYSSASCPTYGPEQRARFARRVEDRLRHLGLRGTHLHGAVDARHRNPPQVPRPDPRPGRLLRAELDNKLAVRGLARGTDGQRQPGALVHAQTDSGGRHRRERLELGRHDGNRRPGRDQQEGHHPRRSSRTTPRTGPTASRATSGSGCSATRSTAPSPSTAR